MENHQYSIILFCIIVIFIIGCNSSENQENISSQPQNLSYPSNSQTENSFYNPPSEVPNSNVIMPDKNEVVQAPEGSNLLSQYSNFSNNNETGNLPKAHWDSEYETIYQSSRFVDTQHETLKSSAQRFLDNYSPGNDSIFKNKFMLVAIIGSVASYWGNDTNSARDFAQKAFSYRNGSIDFPDHWKLQNWWYAKGTELAEKMATAKDFVLSCSNAGIENYEQANREFIARGQFAKGIEYYSQALKMGLENSELRCTAYLRLSASLFKAQKLDDAEEVFLHTWLKYRTLEIDFGDQETREYLKALSEKYK